MSAALGAENGGEHKGRETAVASEGEVSEGNVSAAVVLCLYIMKRGDDLVDMLQELEGSFAFLIFDHDRRCVFAACSPSCNTSLYYGTDQDGSTWVTPHPTYFAQLGAIDPLQDEIPPGHFIYGKVPRLYQYALTRKQLETRNSIEEGALDVMELMQYGSM